VGVLLAPGLNFALSTDKDQPIEIEADFAELDDESDVTVYRGNVIVSQGSLRLSGDKLTVNFTEEQELKNAFLVGRPARFKQRPDNKDVDTEGEAMQMEYHANESLLYLIEHAKLNQGQKLLSGHRITYDTERSILTARKARSTEAQQSPSDTAGGGRIRIVIPPKKKSD
jgi:lipopolysaccharide export system protein LptA